MCGGGLQIRAAVHGILWLHGSGHAHIFSSNIAHDPNIIYDRATIIWKRDFVTYMKQAVSVALQKGNARLINRMIRPSPRDVQSSTMLQL